MSRLQVITVLLLLLAVTLLLDDVLALKDDKKPDEDAKPNSIFDLCNVAKKVDGSFCIGGKGKATAFPGDTDGCLDPKNKDCDLVVYGHQLDKADSKGHAIEWQFCVLPNLADIEFRAFTVTKDFTPATDNGAKHVNVAEFVNNGQGTVIRVYDHEGNKLAATEKFYAPTNWGRIESKPPMYCVNATSPSVLEFPDSAKTDLINDKLFPVLAHGQCKDKYGNGCLIVFRHQPSTAQQLFKANSGQSTSSATMTFVVVITAGLIRAALW